jgi:hypothetical protein
MFEFLKATAPIVGSLISGGASRDNQREATARNKEAMQKRHQWEVNDLKAAGLNPILSAGGQGTGGMPSAQGAPVPDYGATITNALQMSSNLEKQDAEIKQILNQAGLTRIQQDQASYQVDLLIQELQRSEYHTIEEATRHNFIMGNQKFLEYGKAMKEIGVRGDALAGVLSSVFQIPVQGIKKLFSELFGGKK